MFGGLVRLLFPPICHVCGADTAEFDPFLCPDCVAELWRPGVRFAACQDVPFVSWMGWLGPYDGAVKRAVHAVKFARHRRFARHLGWMLGRRLPAHVPAPDYLVAVPSSERVLATRGFNQAEEIALGLSEALDVPVRDGVLGRARHTTPQRSLPLEARFGNVQGAFSLKRSQGLMNRRIGLVDDVTTTGSTLASAARMLRAFGACEVIGFVLGRTPKKDRPERRG